MMDRFHYLPVGLGLVLAFVGVKMVIGGHYPIPIGWSLGVVAVLLAGSVAASLLLPSRPGKAARPAPSLPRGRGALSGPAGSSCRGMAVTGTNLLSLLFAVFCMITWQKV